MNTWVQCMYHVIEYEGVQDFGQEYWKLVYEKMNKEKHPPEYIVMHHFLAQHKKYVELRKTKRDITFFSKLKYNLLQQTLNGPFNTPDNVDTFISLFWKTQRIYNGFARFAHRFRLKQSQLRIDSDLCLNPIASIDPNAITIFQNASRYRFKISDLINICNSALTNSDEFFSEPMIPKNPYTNLEFTYPILYKIYNAVRHSNYRMPILLHLFYLSDFDINVFHDKNEAIIRYEHIIDYAKNSEDSELVAWVPYMLTYTKMSQFICIHENFPNNILAKVMRPFLKDYFISHYSLYKTNEKHKSLSRLKYKLQKFHKRSPGFGRQIYTKSVTKRGFKISYITNCITYQQIHTNNSILESSLDSDSESDSESDELYESEVSVEVGEVIQSRVRLQALLDVLTASINNTARHEVNRIPSPISDSEMEMETEIQTTDIDSDDELVDTHE